MTKLQSIVGLILVLAIGLAVWFGVVRKAPVAFKDLPGVYICKDFGLPYEGYTKLRIDPDFKMYGMSESGEQLIGVLEDKGGWAQLSFSMDLVHAPEFKLDPFYPHRIEGFTSGINVTTKDATKEISAFCSRQ